MASTPGHSWVVLKGSVCGAAHQRNGLPNQDAIDSWPDADGGPPIFLAVSDGHGSPKCFRSKEGAHIAVAKALEVAQEFWDGVKDAPVADAKALAELKLPTKIVARWREAVAEDLRSKPFDAVEEAQLERAAGAAAVAALGQDGGGLLAYGATLLMAVVTPAFVVYLQLGDGDILAVSDEGTEVERPIPDDPTLMANETTSLCMAKAQNLFRVRFQFLVGKPPGLILLSTDGYSNSFASPGDFEKVGTDLLNIIRREGVTDVNANLKSWLDDASTAGSGDDVTLGLVCRRDLVGVPLASAYVEESNGRGPPSESSSATGLVHDDESSKVGR